MTAQELKPCPFCGKADTIILNGPVEDDWCAVACCECNARGPINYTDPHAIAAWNIRADLIPAALAVPEVAALVDGLTHMQWCRHCAEGSWEDCEGGRAALAALAALRGEGGNG